MPNTTPSEMAKRFSEYHNATIAASAATQENTVRKQRTKNIGKRKAAATRAANVSAEGRKAQVIKLLQRPTGATTAQISKATGMQEHSARALLSGIAKDIDLVKTKSGGNATVYKIVIADAAE